MTVYVYCSSGFNIRFCRVGDKQNKFVLERGAVTKPYSVILQRRACSGKYVKHTDNGLG